MKNLIIFLYNFLKTVQYVLGETMKKLIIGIILIVFLFLFSSNNETIRFRVLANSNSEYDQNIKKEVVSIVKDEFKNILTNTRDIEDARNIINNNLDNISNKVDTFLLDHKIKYKSNINFGLNYFPSKELNGKTYDEGYYESVLITLGKGEGDNFWCILFPSVCLTNNETKYESFLSNLFNKIFK